VILDYAGGCVRRQLSYEGRERIDKHELLNDFTRACRDRIAAPLHCPVWVTHQLTAGLNGKGLGVAMDACNAAEGRNFAGGTEACLALGPMELATTCVRLACVRGPGTGREVLLQLDGRYGALCEPPPAFLYARA
jgi:hypothetical protein